MVEVITRLDWLTRDVISKFIYYEMDARMNFIEKAIQSSELMRLLR